MKIISTITAGILAGVNAYAGNPNTLTKAEKKQGFTSLFDGKSFKGWKHNGNWEVEDNVLTREGKGGSIVYTAAKVPDDFELRFEWKVAPGSNSGIYYRPTQYEYQILDNGKHRAGGNPRTSAASLYFCMAPSHDATKKPGEWNTFFIRMVGEKVSVWLNNTQVVDRTVLENFWDKERKQKLPRADQIELQHHGSELFFKNLYIKELPY